MELYLTPLGNFSGPNYPDWVSRPKPQNISGLCPQTTLEGVSQGGPQRWLPFSAKAAGGVSKNGPGISQDSVPHKCDRYL